MNARGWREQHAKTRVEIECDLGEQQVYSAKLKITPLSVLFSPYTEQT